MSLVVQVSQTADKQGTVRRVPPARAARDRDSWTPLDRAGDLPAWDRPKFQNSEIQFQISKIPNVVGGNECSKDLQRE